MFNLKVSSEAFVKKAEMRRTKSVLQRKIVCRDRNSRFEPIAAVKSLSYPRWAWGRDQFK
ncbi:MAG: hypothetical protein NW216_04265 [Hyphomicrobium sp.]|nr:hypothetical protein [Hyphomicrobium sp.]